MYDDEDEPQIDITKLRYVLYARKSTDDPQRQIRSVPDQIDECKKLAERNNIRIVKVLREDKSAKIPGKSDVFTKELIAGIENNKYDAILAWNPDRLARNMIEGSSILNYVDSGKLKDLKFVTHYFTNDASGKMLLGISFVKADYYSRNLSQNVSRGVKKGLKEGKSSGTPKHGYIRGDDGIYRPDNEDGSKNFNLICQAWRMRKDNKSLESIAKYMTDNGYSRTYKEKAKKAGEKVLMTDKILSDRVFNDPFYFGMYKYGDIIANLNEQYNFLPLITPDEFIALSRNTADNFSEQFVGRGSSAKRLDFGLLREKVICDYCDKIMIFQRTKLTKGKNAGHYMLSFYCRNKECIRHNKDEAIKKYGKQLSKSIRAKFVVSHIEWTLRHCTKQSEKAYKLYIGRLEQKLVVDKEIAKRKLSDARSELKKQETLYAKYQNLQLISLADYNKHHKGKLEFHQNLINICNSSIETLQTEVEKLNQGLPTRQQFIELVRSYLETLLKTTDLIEEDTVYQELVLNLRAGDDAVSVIKLNPPYNLLVDLDKVSLGRGDRT